MSQGMLESCGFLIILLRALRGSLKIGQHAILIAIYRSTPTYWAQLKDVQAKFAEQASQVKSLGDGPYNTDDDLALLMYEQQYELAYSVAKNSACK